jgi:hypothetical protein
MTTRRDCLAVGHDSSGSFERPQPSVPRGFISSAVASCFTTADTVAEAASGDIVAAKHCSKTQQIDFIEIKNLKIT